MNEIENSRGFAFPFRIDEGGSVAQSNDVLKIRENIRHILLTGVGERVMRPDYGGGLRQLLHEPNNMPLQAVVQYQVGKTIGQWEPRVQLQELNVTQEGGTLYIHVRYVIRRSGQAEHLSVPLELGGA